IKTENDTEPAAEDINKDIAETVDESVARSAEVISTEPTLEAEAEQVEETVAESASNAVVETITEPVTEPIVESAIEDASKPAFEHVDEAPTREAVEKAILELADPVPVVDTAPTTEPAHVEEPITEATREDAVQSVADNANFADRVVSDIKDIESIADNVTDAKAPGETAEHVVTSASEFVLDEPVADPIADAVAEALSGSINESSPMPVEVAKLADEQLADQAAERSVTFAPIADDMTEDATARTIDHPTAEDGKETEDVLPEMAAGVSLALSAVEFCRSTQC
ncbi:hypothetical protein GGI05_006363, partial [Coemansia sp. RSA 2603]